MLRLVSIMLFFNVTDEHLMLFARLKAGTSNMRLESIVMHLQGSAHRVRSVCRVWERASPDYVGIFARISIRAN